MTSTSSEGAAAGSTGAWLGASGVGAGRAVVTRGSGCAPGGPVYDAFFRLTADGARPTTVLDSRADDEDHLTARGITEVVTSDQVLPTPSGGTRS